ncbi:MAG: CDP-glucose 4,6-dehydratase [Lachnospiraceae bacterium]|nr:CDP-glucose 4,6-dehydratase [Lachnospiraceae bacterium]
MLNGLSFYKDRKVLITGHTGFKGAWMCKALVDAGADVTGYALEPPTSPALFTLCGVEEGMRSVLGDVRDLRHMKQVFEETQPEIVIHMAAQPIVRESYKNPVYTYEVNVMGTVHVLECVRNCHSVRSFVNVTTDKVYWNREWEWGYREDDILNGYDPYSNSKSCSELVTSSYLNSFFQPSENAENSKTAISAVTAISTVRAGNVIGGGDFATDRIIPDCIRAASAGRDIIVRNPHSTRPYEHVLEPVMAYLMIAQAQYENPECAGSYNVGPNDADCLTTGKLTTLFCDKWNRAGGNPVRWVNQYDGGPHEAGFLKLDCSRIKKTFGWAPRWNVGTAMEKIVEWTKVYLERGDVAACMEKQIGEYLGRK